MGKFVIIFRHETGLDKVKRGFVILFVSCELDEINEKIITDNMVTKVEIGLGRPPLGTNCC